MKRAQEQRNNEEFVQISTRYMKIERVAGRQALSKSLDYLLRWYGKHNAVNAKTHFDWHLGHVRVASVNTTIRPHYADHAVRQPLQCI